MIWYKQIRFVVIASQPHKKTLWSVFIYIQSGNWIHEKIRNKIVLKSKTDDEGETFEQSVTNKLYTSMIIAVFSSRLCIWLNMDFFSAINDLLVKKKKKINLMDLTNRGDLRLKLTKLVPQIKLFATAIKLKYHFYLDFIFSSWVRFIFYYIQNVI